MSSPASRSVTDRRYPMAKPDGFVPAVQRYSSRFDPGLTGFHVLYLGVQIAAEHGSGPDHPAVARFAADTAALFAAEHGPAHVDHAHHVDDHGAYNRLAVAYWQDRAGFPAWWSSDEVSSWWQALAAAGPGPGPAGYFAEPLPATVSHTETVAFAEYLRGVSACPMSSVEPMGESGYWGAARDRLPASAVDDLLPAEPMTLTDQDDVASVGRRLVVHPPSRYCLIRSGVSWEACGPEQLSSYETNVAPRLNEGMAYLRANPIESGCWSLRQVDVIDGSGAPAKEAYSLGHFLTFDHLEHWAHHHPTHLAIYGQAQKERIRYAEKLELRTYHEVFVVDEPEPFEYLNCHPRTGALGLLPHRAG